MGKKVIKPGIWWIVRFRRFHSYEQITGYLICKNGYHAGHSGFDRKRCRRRHQKVTQFRSRVWDLKGWDHRRFAYRFAEYLSDLRTTIRSKLITDWMKEHDGILEVVEVEGCLHYGTVTSEKVIDRKFNTTNEMEILALEYGMGE